MTALMTAMCLELDAAEVGTYDPDNPISAGVAISAGALPPSPDECVMVTTYAGGPEPDSRNLYEFPRMQVRVRAATADRAQAIDRAAYHALHFTPDGPRPRAVAGWWLQDCYALQSEAEPIGLDDNGRHEFTRNYQLEALEQP